MNQSPKLSNNKSSLGDHSSTPLKYNFTNLSLIVQDVQKRNYFYRKTASLLERKSNIDLNYANLLDNIIAKQYHRATNNKLPSQALFGKLVSIMQEEPKRIRQLAESMKEEADKMNQAIDLESGELKKALESAQKINKQILYHKEKLEKSKKKFGHKNKDLQLLKIQYMAGVMGNQQLQKTNNIYLSLNELQASVKPLMDQYKLMSYRFNETVAKMVDQFNHVLQKIQEVESKKIKNIKISVAKYVKLNKSNLDEVLERYPFLCQDIDRMRQTEEFIPHSCEALINQLEELDRPLDCTGYVDSIYERIEIKKNLEEILIYGQDPEHKRTLNSSFTNQIQQREQNPNRVELQPKTIRMVEIFKSVFEGDSTLNMLSQLRSLFRGDEKIRKDFILCLQQYRINSQFELALDKKERIIDCIKIFLDMCDLEFDTYNSKMLMVLSLTYFFVQNGSKVELQQLISTHKIWTKIEWWQAALLETIYEETRLRSKFRQNPIRIWDIKAGGTNKREEGEEETYQHICFNQILFFVRNMSLFHISPEQIVQYAKLNINMLKFTGKFARDILDLCPQSPTMSKHSYSSP